MHSKYSVGFVVGVIGFFGAFIAVADTSVVAPNPVKSVFKETGDEITITIDAPQGMRGARPTVISINKATLTNAISIDEPRSSDSDSSTNSNGNLTVVVGERVRASADIATVVNRTSIVKNPRTVESRSDLALVAARAILADSNAKNISYDSGSISVEYDETVTFLGIVPLHAWSEVQVGTDGRVSIRYPWWSRFFKKDILPKEMKESLALALSEKSKTLGNLDVYARQAVMIDTVADVMKEKHDAVKN